MDAYIRAIALALYCAHQTDEIATATECALHSWIRSSVPLDDSLKWIPESGGFKSLTVPNGQEGASLILLSSSGPKLEMWWGGDGPIGAQTQLACAPIGLTLTDVPKYHRVNVRFAETDGRDEITVEPR